jgi:arabinogalactan endo-1,4-beta-galactosidase
MTMRSLLVALGCALCTAATAAEFIVGADVSTLTEVERHGGRFTDEDGRPGDALHILRDHGVNWVRLRLWHTPVNAADVVEGGRVIARRGEPVGGGNNGLALTLALAKRARADGLKVLLDIHYSDFWADPGTQTKPAAWTQLHGTALRRAVRAYTADVLRAFREGGAPPDMVQIGNETNGGMLWPDGKTWQQTPDEKIGGARAFASLLRAGIAGVREHDRRAGRRLPVVIHLAGADDNRLFRRVFDMARRERLDYDVIGLSYYPYYHGPMARVRANLADLARRYRKPLLIVEVAWGYTLDNADATPNIFNAELAAKGGYPASVEGQAAAVRDIVDVVAAVPGGLGVFYWEPAWIPVPGAGWRTGAGANWENQAMFDFNGRALPSLKALRPPWR